MGDEDKSAMVQLVASAGGETVTLGYAFQLEDGSQVLIQADSKLPEAGKAGETRVEPRVEESSAALGLDPQAGSSVQTLALDYPAESPPDADNGGGAAAVVAAVRDDAAVSADAAGRRRVAVILSEEGVATAVPLHSVVESGLSQRILFQEDGQPVILEVLDHETTGGETAEGTGGGDQSSEGVDCQSWFNKRDRAGQDGRQMKTGMWSRDEVDMLSANMEQFCRERGINNPEDIIFRCSKDERKNFYRTVARGINRPLFSIYRRIIRMYDAKNHVGRYTEEEVEQLRNLRAIHGNRWGTIGALMGRSAASVKDRVRVIRDNCNQGKWLKEEEERLEQAVADLTDTQPGQQVTSGINWAAVAQKVVTRSQKQCRGKWLNNLSWKTAGGEEWTREDERRLVGVLLDSDATEEGQVDWSSLAESWPRSSVRSPQWLRARWWSLKQQLKNHQRLSFREVLVGLLAMKPASLLEPWQETELEETPDPPPAAPQPLLEPGARVFVDQEGRVIPGGSLAVQEDAAFMVDPLSDVGYPGAAVMIGGQLYTTLPTHLLMHGAPPAAGDPAVVVEPAPASVLHHPAVTLPPDVPGVALVSAPSLPDHEYSDDPSREARLARTGDTSIIREDPIMSRTAPGATSEEDESLDCTQ